MRDAAPADSPARGAWLWLGLLIGVTLSGSLCTYCIDGLVDPIKRDLRISDLQMSFVLGWAYIGVYALLCLPAGWLVDRRSRRLILAASTLLLGTGAVVCALAHSLPALWAGRALVGVGQAALAPASMSILADTFPTRLRARVFGATLAAWGVGPGVGLTASGFLLGLAQLWRPGDVGDWRAAILGCALPAFVLAAFVLLSPEPPRKRAPQSGQAAGRAGARFWAPLAVTLLAIAAVTLSDGAQLSWLSAALVREHAVAPAVAARDAGYVFIVCGGLAPLIAGSLADFLFRRHGIPGRLAVALAAVALLVVLQCFYSVHATTLLLLVVLGTGLTVVTGEVVGAAVLQDIVPDDRRGLAAAANALCGSMAIAVGTTGVALAAHLHPAAAHPVTEAMSLVTVPASALSFLVFLALLVIVSRTRPELRERAAGT